ncbi:MAG: glycoside hydrolase family 2 [Bacteroidales bacterium]|nr:glycoside hydrolase family 2 [Bacteroidales bacterium]
MKSYFLIRFILIILFAGNINHSPARNPSAKTDGIPTVSVISLDGEWLLSTDPLNVGRNEKWWKSPVKGSTPVKVPWILQDAFPGYHGVAWYWRDFIAPENTYPAGRTLLRFWSVDYMGDVWLNNVFAGRYESGDVPFVIDVTDFIRPGVSNHLSVRVLNPSNEPIDSMTLKQIPRQARTIPYRAGGEYNCGGITGSVELMMVPVIRIEDIFASAAPESDIIKIEANIRNAGTKTIRRHLLFTVAPAASGESLKSMELDYNVPPGDTIIRTEIKIENPNLWELNNPYLYRISLRITDEKEKSADERSVRFGFRDFRFEKGSFRLNGKRIFLRSAHSCNNYPVGQRLPTDPDLARRDLLDMKVMGFNAIRFIWGGAQPYQLDLCDEIGLMVYNESFASQGLDSTAMMFERFDRSQLGMIRRDRNHPSVVIWGLLNETFDGLVFRHAVALLPAVRSLDNSRMVLLGSGRWDGQFSIGSLSNPGSGKWEYLLGKDSPHAAGSKMTWGGYTENSGDAHVYPVVPQTAQITGFIRNLGKDTKPVLLSEYGIGSSVDLWRVTRHFETIGKENAEDAIFYKDKLDKYLADWEKWNLKEIYIRPEDFFKESISRMAGQRRIGLTAIRSNPKIAGYNLTGMNDHVMGGEGLTTTFRELKPGTVDAMFEELAPYGGVCLLNQKQLSRRKVKLEVVLANEDVLRPGDYPVLIQVTGPGNQKIYEHKTTVTIRGTQDGAEPPLAQPVFSVELPIDGPAGKYHLLATLEKGGAPGCGDVEFWIDDLEQMPAVETVVTLWGTDTLLASWLNRHQIKTQHFKDEKQKSREVILVGAYPPEGKDTLASFTSLLQHVARGSCVIFLSPEVFKSGNNPVGFLPLEKKGSLSTIYSWLYLKDEWAKKHPIFEALPSGGLMDHQFYREIIPGTAGTGQDPPKEAVAGAIKSSLDYESGLMVSVNSFGSGNFILNTLLIHNNLDIHPAAERLLRNLINYAARDMKKTAEKLPPDFDLIMKKIGYK